MTWTESGGKWSQKVKTTIKSFEINFTLGMDFKNISRLIQFVVFLMCLDKFVIGFVIWYLIMKEMSNMELIQLIIH